MSRTPRAELIGNVADARRLARRTLPPVVFDYIDGAADDESTMRQNESAFEKVVFRPRMAAGITKADLATTVLGQDVSMPLLLAPCGLIRLMHPDAGPGVARAAESKGTLSCLSTVAGSSIEEVAGAVADPSRTWFQLYAAGGRPDAEALLGRAEAAGMSVLVVTVDTPALGNRERDKRHGVTPPLRIDARRAAHLGPQVLLRPAWTYRMARDGVSTVRRSKQERATAPATAGDGESQKKEQGFKMLSMAASPFSWADIEWLRERWTGKLAVKGVLTGEDAARSIDCGADAVIVSNHGGRQLDGAPATIDALPEVVAAVGGRGEVILDSGVRRGSHVVKALALGARAVMIGRAYLYALSAAGQPGVERMIDVLGGEIVRTMILLGCPSVADLGPEWIRGAGVEG